MSERKELNRSDLVRLRRERENTQRMERAGKVATRAAPVVTTRGKPKHKTARASRARRFQTALLL